MSSIRLSRYCVIALVVLLGSGCSKKSNPVADPVANGGGVIGTPVSGERRAAVLNGFTATVNALTTTDPNAVDQQLLAYLHSQAEFAASGVSTTGSIWAVFTDGRALIYSPSFDNTTLSPYGASEVLPQRAATLQKVSDNLPASKTAVVLNALGSRFERTDAGYVGAEKVRKDITQFLTDAGYTVRPGNDATINGLKSVNGNDAVFHITTHGDIGKIFSRQGDYSALYGIWTSEKYDKNVDTTYQTLFDEEELCYFSAPNTAGVPSEIHYAITSNFVNHYMHFGTNSLVYITACLSNSDDASDFKAAFISKGASVYGGWSNYADAQGAFYAARFFFDRCLGMNKVNPIPTPAQRPFEYYLVLEDLQNRGKDKTTATVRSKQVQATLTFDLMRDDFGMLLPTISFGSLSDQSKYAMNGTFGTVKGLVKFNGAQVSTDPWNSSHLSLPHPQNGGLLWVDVNGLTSNKIPFAEWDGTVTYTVTGLGSLLQTVTLNLVLVGDVHRYRMISGANQFFPDADSWGGLRTLYVSPKSSGTYAASGEYRDPNTHEVLESWGGGASLVPVAFGSTDVGFSVLALVDSVGGQANLIVSLKAPFVVTTKDKGAQTSTISLGGLGSIIGTVGPSFVLPPTERTSGGAKFVWSGATPDPRFLQSPTDQR